MGSVCRTRKQIVIRKEMIKKKKYLKIDWRSVDLEELIEHIDSQQNIKRTCKNIGGRHPSKRIHPDLIDTSLE